MQISEGHNLVAIGETVQSGEQRVFAARYQTYNFQASHIADLCQEQERKIDKAEGNLQAHHKNELPTAKHQTTIGFLLRAENI